jgi:hypothetical protein
LDEPVAECGEHLGWCCPGLLDGRDAASAESHADCDDEAEGGPYGQVSIPEETCHKQPEEITALKL